MSEPRKPLDLAAVRERNGLVRCCDEYSDASLQDVGPLCDEVEVLRKALRDRLHSHCSCPMCREARVLLGEEVGNVR